jgi:hypothetical protein
MVNEKAGVRFSTVSKVVLADRHRITEKRREDVISRKAPGSGRAAELQKRRVSEAQQVSKTSIDATREATIKFARSAQLPSDNTARDVFMALKTHDAALYGELNLNTRRSGIVRADQRRETVAALLEYQLLDRDRSANLAFTSATASTVLHVGTSRLMYAIVLSGNGKREFVNWR